MFVSGILLAHPHKIDSNSKFEVSFLQSLPAGNKLVNVIANNKNDILIVQCIIRY